MNMFPISANRSMNEQSVLRGEYGVVSVAGAKAIQRTMNSKGWVDAAQARSFLGTDQTTIDAHARNRVVETQRVQHGPYGGVEWYSLLDLRLLKARQDLVAAGRRPL